jgi:WG containing repeat
MGRAINYARSALTSWMIFWIVAGILVCIPVARACSWSYVIWGIRNKPADPLFRFVRNGRAGYIDSTGRIIIQPLLPAGDNFFGEFHEGLVAVKDDHGYQYLDRSGRLAFRIDAWFAFDFSEGLAPASRNNGSPKWGFVDRTGNFVVPPQYFAVGAFSEGLAKISVSGEVGSTGYIDHDGKFNIPAQLSYGSSFHEGLAAVIIEGPCRISNGGSCGLAEFQPTQPRSTSECRYAFIDKSGKTISELRFDVANDFSEGLAAVRIGRQWGYVDRSGRISISPKFYFAEQFSEGLAAVIQDGKTGFIDRSGNFVIPPQFESAGNFSDGRALITEFDGRGRPTYRFITRNGKFAFPGTFAAAAPFSYGLAHVALNGLSKGTLAWINTSGEPVFTYAGH